MRKHPELQRLFLPIIIAILIVTTILFHPGIRPNLDHSYRQNKLSEFIRNIKEEKKLDPQKYWLFRERYSPGDFRYNDDAIEMLQTFRIVKLNDIGATELLYYSGKYLNSTDSVTTDLSLEKEVVEGGSLIIDLENLQLIKMQNNSYILKFLLPISEMKKANGFFDYLESENKLLENKFWLNKTVIK